MEKQNQFQSSLIRLDRLDKTIKPQAFYDNRKRDYEKYVADRQSLYSNYNDPYQINSVADVVLTTFNTDMKRESFFGLENIPILNILPSAWQVLKNYSFKPMAQGKFGTMLLNNVMNFGETLGVAGNMVKGLLYDGPNGLFNSLGWGDAGRKNYDINSKELVDLGWGNIVVDMIAEIVVDPLNWVTLFGPTVVYSKFSEPVEAFIRENVPGITDETIKYMTKKSIKAFMLNDKQTMGDALGAVFQSLYAPQNKMQAVQASFAKMFNGINNPFTPEVMEKLEMMYLKGASKEMTEAMTQQIGQIAFERLRAITLDQASQKVLNSLANAKSITNNVQKTLATGWLATTGIGSGYLAYKYGVPWFRSISGQLSRKASLVAYQGAFDYDNIETVKHYTSEAIDNLSLGKMITEQDTANLDVVRSMVKTDITQTANFIRPILTDSALTVESKLAQITAYLNKAYKVSTIDEYITKVNSVNKDLVFEQEVNELQALQSQYLAVIETPEEALNKLEYSTSLALGIKDLFQDIIEGTTDDVHIKFQELLQDAIIDAYEAGVTDDKVVHNKVALDKLTNDVNRLISDGMAKVSNKLVVLAINKGLIQDKQITNEYQKLFLQFREDIQRKLHNTLKYAFTETSAGKLKEANLVVARVLHSKALRNKIDGILDEFNKLITHILNSIDAHKEAISIKGESTTINKFITKNGVEKNLGEVQQNIIKKYATNLDGSVKIYKFDIKNAKANIKNLVYVLKNTESTEIVLNDNSNYFTNLLHNVLDSYIKLAELDTAFDNKVEEYKAKGLNEKDIEFKRHKVLQQYIDSYSSAINKLEYALQNNNLLNGELEEVINDLRPDAGNDYYMEVLSEGYSYILKQENMWVSISNVNNSAITDLIAKFDHKSSKLGSHLNKMSNYYKDMMIKGDKFDWSNDMHALAYYSNQVEQSLKYARNYRDMVLMVLNNEYISLDVKSSFLSSIEKMWSLNPLADVYDNLDNKSEELIRYTQEHLQTRTQYTSLSIDELRMTPEYIDIDKDNPYPAHTAQGDTYTYKEIIKRNFSKYFEDPNLNYIIADTETTGTVIGLDNIIGLNFRGLHNDLDITLQRKINPNDNSLESSVTESFLDKMGLTREEYFKLYDKGFYDDKSYIKYIYTTLETLISKSNKKIALVIHNGLKFDIPMLRSAFERYNLNTDILNQFVLIDGLEVMQKANKFPFVGSVEKEELAKIFKAYTENMVHSNLNKFVSPGVSDLKYNLRQYTAILEKQNLKESAELLGDAKMYLTSFGEIIEGVYNINKKHKDTLLHSSVFDIEKTDQGLEMMRELVNTMWFKDKPLSMQNFIKMFGSYMNMSKFLYMYSSGVNTLGYKIGVDWESINKLTIYKDIKKISKRTAMGLTNVFKLLKRQRNKIKNPAVIFIKSKEIDDVINNIKTHLTKDKQFAWFSNFDFTDADTIDKYLFARYTYKSLATQKGYEAIDKIFTDKPLLYLFNTDYKVIYGTTYGTRSDYLDYAVNEIDPLPDNLLTEAQEFKYLKDKANKRINSLNKLATNIENKLDNTGLNITRTQAIASGLQPIVEPLAYCEELMNNEQDMTKQILISKNIKLATNQFAKSATVQWLQQTPIQMQQTMVWFAPFSFIQSFDEFTNDYLKTILRNKEAYEKCGILISYDENSNRYIFRLKKEYMPVIDKYDDADIFTYSSNGVEIPKPTHLKEIEVKWYNDTLSELMTKAKAQLNVLGSNNATGTLGNTISEAAFKKFFKTLPQKIQNEYKSYDWGALFSAFFTEPKFNHIVQGDMTFRRKYEKYLPVKLMHTYAHTGNYLSKIAETKVLYTEMMFNPMMSLNMNSLGKMSNEELLQFFKYNENFVLAQIVKDDTYEAGYKMIQLETNTIEDITLAKNLNAVALPYQTFSKAFQVINKNKISNKAITALQSILHKYKVGYLLSSGTVMRNVVDGFIRNMTTNNVGVIEQAKWYYSAIKLLNNYESICEDIIDMYKSLGQDAINKYFKKVRNIKLDNDMFQLVHDFIKDGPSAGESEALQKYKNSLRDNRGDMDMFNFIINRLMKPNMKVEQVARLSQYLLLLDRGQSTTSAMAKIAKTHFDFDIKTDTQKMLELVIPFYTFMQNNISYWVSMLEKYPWLWSLIRDTMTPIWDFDEYDSEELSWNRSLQYQILSGAIPLDDKGLTLKINPSFLDVYSLFGNPIDTITGKLSAPLQLLVKSGAISVSGDDVGFLANAMGAYRTDDVGERVNEIMNLIPIAGVAYQRIQTAKRNYDRTDNLLNLVLPTAFGATKQYPEQTKVLKAKKSYNKIRPTTYIRSGNTNYSRYTMGMKKMYAKKTYVKNIYSKRRVHLKNYYPSNRINNDATVYQKLYTKQGRSRMLQRLYPNNPKHALKVIHSIFNQ